MKNNCEQIVHWKNDVKEVSEKLIKELEELEFKDSLTNRDLWEIKDSAVSMMNIIHSIQRD